MTATSVTGQAAGSDTHKTRLLTDFTPDSPDLKWYVVNDSVMGGRSDGDFKTADGKLLFTGRTNTNGGGFSSIRTGSVQLDLSNHDGIQLYARGDGRRYTWRLTTNASWRGRPVAYWADFDTKGDQENTINIPFTHFVPRFRGTELDGPPLNTSEITGMGLMIYDNEDGPFEIHLHSVHAYSSDSVPMQHAKKGDQ